MLIISDHFVKSFGPFDCVEYNHAGDKGSYLGRHLFYCAACTLVPILTWSPGDDIRNRKGKIVYPVLYLT